MSAFAWYSKKSSRNVWGFLSIVTRTVVPLSDTPHQVLAEDFKTLKRFVILMYDRTIDCSDINSARRDQFTKKGRQ